MPPSTTTSSNPLLAQFGGVLGDMIKEVLISKRTEIINAINAKLNVPILSEELEGRLIGVVYDVLVEVVDDVI